LWNRLVPFRQSSFALSGDEEKKLYCHDVVDELELCYILVKLFVDCFWWWYKKVGKLKQAW